MKTMLINICLVGGRMQHCEWFAVRSNPRWGVWGCEYDHNDDYNGDDEYDDEDKWHDDDDDDNNDNDNDEILLDLLIMINFAEGQDDDHHDKEEEETVKNNGVFTKYFKPKAERHSFLEDLCFEFKQTWHQE